MVRSSRKRVSSMRRKSRAASKQSNHYRKSRRKTRRKSYRRKSQRRKSYRRKSVNKQLIGGSGGRKGGKQGTTPDAAPMQVIVAGEPEEEERPLLGSRGGSTGFDEGGAAGAAEQPVVDLEAELGPLVPGPASLPPSDVRTRAAARGSLPASGFDLKQSQAELKQLREAYSRAAAAAAAPAAQPQGPPIPKERRQGMTPIGAASAAQAAAAATRRERQLQKEEAAKQAASSAGERLDSDITSARKEADAAGNARKGSLLVQPAGQGVEPAGPGFEPEPEPEPETEAERLDKASDARLSELNAKRESLRGIRDQRTEEAVRSQHPVGSHAAVPPGSAGGYQGAAGGPADPPRGNADEDVWRTEQAMFINQRRARIAHEWKASGEGQAVWQGIVEEGGGDGSGNLTPKGKKEFEERAFEEARLLDTDSDLYGSDVVRYETNAQRLREESLRDPLSPDTLPAAERAAEKMKLYQPQPAKWSEKYLRDELHDLEEEQRDHEEKLFKLDNLCTDTKDQITSIKPEARYLANEVEIQKENHRQCLIKLKSQKKLNDQLTRFGNVLPDREAFEKLKSEEVMLRDTIAMLRRDLQRCIENEEDLVARLEQALKDVELCKIRLEQCNELVSAYHKCLREINGQARSVAQYVADLAQNARKPPTAPAPGKMRFVIRGNRQIPAELGGGVAFVVDVTDVGEGETKGDTRRQYLQQWSGSVTADRPDFFKNSNWTLESYSGMDLATVDNEIRKQNDYITRNDIANTPVDQKLLEAVREGLNGLQEARQRLMGNYTEAGVRNRVSGVVTKDLQVPAHAAEAALPKGPKSPESYVDQRGIGGRREQDRSSSPTSGNIGWDKARRGLVRSGKLAQLAPYTLPPLADPDKPSTPADDWRPGRNVREDGEGGLQAAKQPQGPAVGAEIHIQEGFGAPDWRAEEGATGTREYEGGHGLGSAPPPVERLYTQGHKTEPDTGRPSTAETRRGQTLEPGPEPEP